MYPVWGSTRNSNPCSHFFHYSLKTSICSNTSHLWWYQTRHCRMKILDASWNMYIHYQSNDFPPFTTITGSACQTPLISKQWSSSMELCGGYDVRETCASCHMECKVIMIKRTTPAPPAFLWMVSAERLLSASLPFVSLSVKRLHVIPVESMSFSHGTVKYLGTKWQRYHWEIEWALLWDYVWVMC